MKTKPNPKRAKVLSIIASITLVLFITGASVAWFISGIDEGAIQNTRVTTGATDSLVFKFGDEIKFTASEENFLSANGSTSGLTTGKAILKTTTATSTTYNVYVLIEENNFEYTQEDKTPELLLKVTKPDGTILQTTTKVTELSNVIDNKGVQQTGFDITKEVGLFTIVEDYEIATTATELTKEQEWKFEITFVNIDANQMGNRNKTFKAKIIMATTKYNSTNMTYTNETYTECGTLACALDELYVKYKGN